LKLFLIGGNAVNESHPEFAKHNQLMRDSASAIGELICDSGNDLLVCSGFPGSADEAAASRAMKKLESIVAARAQIEFYYPKCANVAAQIESVIEPSCAKRVSRFPQVASLDEAKERPTSYDWLLAQLVAMDNANAVIALGGKPDGSASVLLRLAESTGKPILPFAFLGGAAEQSYQRLQYKLRDKLDQRVSSLSAPDQVNTAVELIEKISAEGFNGKTQGKETSFFISYSRDRHEEADFVEMLLRRRDHVLYRDESDFSAGQLLQGEIDGYIHQATVFIALWCKEYACSPWCFDELELALELQKAGSLQVWLLCLDDTRIVPRSARGIVHYAAKCRKDLERCILVLLEHAPCE
jgi:hypothetical protein